MNYRTINIPEPLFLRLDDLAATIGCDPDALATVLLFSALAKETPVNASNPAEAFKGSQASENALRRIQSLRAGELPSWLGNDSTPEA